MKLNNLGIIYLITNIITNEYYVGQTRQSLKNRMRNHFQDKWENCTKLKNAFIKYGKDNFKVQVLETIPYKDLNKRESYYIKLYNSIENGYNIKDCNSKFINRNVLHIKNMIKDICNDYLKGYNCFDIANKYNISKTSVYNALKKGNIKIRYNKGGFNSYCKININKLKELKQQGYTTKYISNYFKVNRSSVKRMINRHKNIIFPRVSNP